MKGKGEILNIYDGVPRGVRTMVDDMIGPIPPSESTIRKEVLNECCRNMCCGGCRACCGENPDVDYYECCPYGWATGWASGCAKLWKIMGWIGLVILGIGAAAGVSYLYFGVLSNAVALLFDDTKCENWVWQTCSSSIAPGDSPVRHLLFTQSLNQFIGFLMHFSVLAPLAIGVIVWVIPTVDANGDEYESCCPPLKIGDIRMPVASVVWFYISYIFFWIIASVFLGKKLAVNQFDGCDIFEPFAITVQETISYVAGGMCGRVVGLGTGLGAEWKSTLPLDTQLCVWCTNTGYWTVLIVAIACPIFIYIFIKIGMCCSRKYKEGVDIVEKRYKVDEIDEIP